MFISVYISLCPVYAQIGSCSGYLPVTWFPHHVFDQSSNQEPLGFRVGGPPPNNLSILSKSAFPWVPGLVYICVLCYLV